MKTQGISWLVLLVSFSLNASSIQAATVGEMNGSVWISNASSQEQEARTGLSAESATIRTGADSRVHIDLDDRSFVRLGSESRLEIVDAREIVLHSGSALFGRSNGKQLELTAGDLKATVNSGTAFATIANGRQPSAAIGALGGEVTVRSGAKKHAVKAGRLMAGGPDQIARIRGFNLPKLMETSRLMTGFDAPLPTVRQVQDAGLRYASLEKRGFVRDDEASFESLQWAGMESDVAAGAAGTARAVEQAIVTGRAVPPGHSGESAIHLATVSASAENRVIFSRQESRSFPDRELPPIEPVELTPPPIVPGEVNIVGPGPLDFLGARRDRLPSRVR